VVAGGNYAYSFPTMNYRRWTDWWGTNIPVFPDDWNTGGTVVASLGHVGVGPFGLFPLGVNSGDTVAGGYELTLGGNHPAATVSLVSGANITTDITCRDGSSYTLTIPLPAQSYSIAAGDNSAQPSPNPSSSLVFQGTATATPPAGTCVAGIATNAYFTATGLSENGDGNPGGPGFLTTDVTDPLSTRFHILDDKSGLGSFYSPPITINFNPLTSANSTNQNPVQP
jgi:hypothetical protein